MVGVENALIRLAPHQRNTSKIPLRLAQLVSDTLEEQCLCDEVSQDSSRCIFLSYRVACLCCTLRE